MGRGILTSVGKTSGMGGGGVITQTVKNRSTDVGAVDAAVAMGEFQWKAALRSTEGITACTTNHSSGVGF